MSIDSTTNDCVHSAIAPNMNRCIKCQRVWDGEKWSESLVARPSLSAKAVGDGGGLIDRVECAADVVDLLNALAETVRLEDRQHCKRAAEVVYRVVTATTPPQPADGGDRVEELAKVLRRVRFAIKGCGDAEYIAMDAAATVGLGQFIDSALAKFQPAGGENDGR